MSDRVARKCGHIIGGSRIRDKSDNYKLVITICVYPLFTLKSVLILEFYGQTAVQISIKFGMELQ